MEEIDNETESDIVLGTAFDAVNICMEPLTTSFENDPLASVLLQDIVAGEAALLLNRTGKLQEAGLLSEVAEIWIERAQVAASELVAQHDLHDWIYQEESVSDFSTLAVQHTEELELTRILLLEEFVLETSATMRLCGEPLLPISLGQHLDNDTFINLTLELQDALDATEASCGSTVSDVDLSSFLDVLPSRSCSHVIRQNLQGSSQGHQSVLLAVLALHTSENGLMRKFHDTLLQPSDGTHEDFHTNFAEAAIGGATTASQSLRARLLQSSDAVLSQDYCDAMREVENDDEFEVENDDELELESNTAMYKCLCVDGELSAVCSLRHGVAVPPHELRIRRAGGSEYAKPESGGGAEGVSLSQQASDDEQMVFQNASNDAQFDAFWDDILGNDAPFDGTIQSGDVTLTSTDFRSMFTMKDFRGEWPGKRKAPCLAGSLTMDVDGVYGSIEGTLSASLNSACPDPAVVVSKSMSLDFKVCIGTSKLSKIPGIGDIIDKFRCSFPWANWQPFTGKFWGSGSIDYKKLLRLGLNFRTTMSYPKPILEDTCNRNARTRKCYTKKTKWKKTWAGWGWWKRKNGYKYVERKCKNGEAKRECLNDYTHSPYTYLELSRFSIRWQWKCWWKFCMMIPHKKWKKIHKLNL